MAEEREARASLLMDHIREGDVKEVETILSGSLNMGQWRDIIRYEFSIQAMMEYTLRYDIIAPRLLAYEITSISPFLYAALKGIDEILVNFIDHDVPVDMAVESGTTALHLASFSGKVSTVKMLINVYKADIDKQDKYGWSALHYACSEGQIEVVKCLAECGANISQRDKDGTSAAFRAEINGYDEIVCFLCEEGEEDELLNVDPDYQGRVPLPKHEGLYSTVNKPKHKSMGEQPEDLYAEVKKTAKEDPGLLRKKDKKISPDRRPVSEILLSSGRPWDSLPCRIKEDPKMTIRRLVRKELEDACKKEGIIIEDDQEPAYETPIAARRKGATRGASKEDIMRSGAVGMDTLSGIMREEALKIIRQASVTGTLPRDTKQDRVGKAQSSSLPNGRSCPDYEDIYETMKQVRQARGMSLGMDDDIPMEPPPLPPRNNLQALFSPGQPTAQNTNNSTKNSQAFKLQPGMPTCESAALKAAVKRLAPKLGLDWKKLAHALPMDSSKANVHTRILEIETQYPDDVQAQATMSLIEWQMNHGFKADTDDLIIGLRKCQLHPLIDEVDMATQEFTA